MNALWMFLAGCGLLTYLLLRRSYRYFGKDPSRPSTAALELQHRPADSWDGMHRDTSALIERQQVELHEMARDLSGQLNTKIILLEQLVADSQRQIERLEQLLAESQQLPDQGADGARQHDLLAAVPSDADQAESRT